MVVITKVYLALMVMESVEKPLRDTCEQCPALCSTVTELCETAECLPPKVAVRKICQDKDVCDVTGASSASQLPRSCQQAADY